MAIFMVSSVGCGLANSFWTLLASRIVMGAGEASIINLTGRHDGNTSITKSDVDFEHCLHSWCTNTCMYKGRQPMAEMTNDCWLR